MSRVLTDSLTYAYAKCEKPNRHYVPSMAIFQVFLFINQNPLDGSQYQLAFPKFRVFMHLWATDFRVYTARRRASFQYFYGLSPPVIMSNRECWVFHPRVGSTPTFYAQHTYFSFLKPRDSFWTLSHVTDPTIEHQTQCRSTMYPQHTIKHQTQCRSLPCTHTHVM